MPRGSELVRELRLVLATVRVGLRRHQLRNVVNIRLGRGKWDGSTRVGRNQPCGQPGRRELAADRPCARVDRVAAGRLVRLPDDLDRVGDARR